MSLINRPECDKQVSNQAVSCPNCGVTIASPPHYHEQSQQLYNQARQPYPPPVYEYTMRNMTPPSKIKKPIHHCVWFWLLVAVGLLFFVPFFIGVIRGALSVAI